MNEVLITSSVLIAALLLLRWLFRQTLSRRVQYALWGLVLVRLLAPAQLPGTQFSVMTSVQSLQKAAEVRLEQPARPIGTAAADGDFPAVPDSGTAPAEPAPAPDLPASPRSAFAAERLLPLIHRAGIALVGVFFLAVNLGFWLRTRRCRRPYPVSGCALRVYLVEEGLSSPCLFGLFPPAIYLTPGAVSSPARLGHVLAHEQTHAWHLDPLWALLRCVCLTVYWFDPLVWIASAAVRTDCELACDEGALSRLGAAERVPYGETLLSLIPVKGAPGQLLLTATTMAAGKKQLKDRILRIAQRPRQLAAAAVVAVLLAGAVGACTFTGAAPAASPAPGAGAFQDWGEPERVISLEGASPYTPEPLAIETVTDWPSSAERYGSYLEEGESPYAIYALRTSYEDPTMYFAVGDAHDPGSYGIFLTLTDFTGGGGWDGESLFGSEGPVESISYLDAGGWPVTDYVYVTRDGVPVLLARTAGNMGDNFHMDCNGDGVFELVAPGQLFFQREDGVYLADVAALWAESYPDYSLEWNRWDPATGLLKATGYFTGQDGVFRSWIRYLRFDGENLLVYRDPRTMDDHVMSGVDAPQAVVDKAKELAQSWMPQPGDVLGTQGSGDPILAAAEYDGWRVESITGPMVIQVGGITVYAYHFNYEYHTTTPDQVMLVGGMYMTEDDWVMPGYPDCDYLFFREEADGSLTFLWHEMSNDTGPEEMIQPGLERLGLLAQDPVYQVQTLWDTITGGEGPVLCLTAADGTQGPQYGVPSGYGNMPWDITSDFRWETVETVPPADLEGVNVLRVSRSDRIFLAFYQGSGLVEYQNEGEHLWFRAERTAADDIFGPGVFELIRQWYDEVEVNVLRTGIVIPDDGRSREELARSWVEQFEGAHLAATGGSKYKYSYVDVTQVEEDTQLDREYYPEGLQDTESFLFWYTVIFVPENEAALYWCWAGNTEEYTGEDAPENALTYGRCGYLYRTEDGWRCYGVGTGP